MPHFVPPSVKASAFNCPHCAAFTSQTWFTLHAEDTEPNSTGFFNSPDMEEWFRTTDQIDEKTRREQIEWFAKIRTGLVFLEGIRSGKSIRAVINLQISKCFVCDKIAIWLAERLIFPESRSGITVHSDVPEAIRADVEEAADVLSRSPRGAAALLRLAVQKLCGHLGEKGKNIDDDIASLVAKGLSPLVQQSLDIVRVIGNEAVHPGVIDLKDDIETATRLFEILNVICEQMITQPKTIGSLYLRLPETKREAIEKRNLKATSKAPLSLLPAP